MKLTIKKTSRSILALIIVTALAFSVGCSSEKSSIVGTWQNSTGTVVFTADGEYFDGGSSGTYTIDDTTLYITKSSGRTLEWLYTIDDNTLILKKDVDEGEYSVSYIYTRTD